MHILYYSNNFLLDLESCSFVFKGLYHTSFKLNIVIFSSALPPGAPWTHWGVHSAPRPLAMFYFPIHPKCRILFVPGWCPVKSGKCIFQQSTACKTCIWMSLKGVKFYLNFLWHNFEKSIWTQLLFNGFCFKCL